MSNRPVRILLITDSLGFPREVPQRVYYDETYIALLKAQFPECDLIHLGRGGGTIADLFEHSVYFHSGIKPDLVLMQCGIVDCAPRALTKDEQVWLPRLPLVGRWIGKLVRRHAKRIRQWRKICYTPMPTFEEYVQRFDALYENVHWIGIAPASKDYESALGGITASIERYNGILMRRKFVGMEDFSSEYIMTDFHHLNRAGHYKLFQRLAEIVRASLAERLAREDKVARLIAGLEGKPIFLMAPLSQAGMKLGPYLGGYSNIVAAVDDTSPEVSLHGVSRWTSDQLRVRAGLYPDAVALDLSVSQKGKEWVSRLCEEVGIARQVRADGIFE